MNKQIVLFKWNNNDVEFVYMLLYKLKLSVNIYTTITIEIHRLILFLIPLAITSYFVKHKRLKGMLSIKRHFVESLNSLSTLSMYS